MHPLCFKANINHTLLTLCAVEENILRVRRFPNGAYSEKEEYFLERELYPFPNAVLTENGVSTAGFRAEVTPDGNVQIFLPNGSLLLAEDGCEALPASLPDHYAAAQRFSSPAGECLYGLGNVNGIMGIKGESVEICHKNCRKRTPFFFSNRGYGLFFQRNLQRQAPLERNGGCLYLSCRVHAGFGLFPFCRLSAGGCFRLSKAYRPYGSFAEAGVRLYPVPKPLPQRRRTALYSRPVSGKRHSAGRTGDRLQMVGRK